jgi:imidazolonepropionase-like amidohydrolase
MSNYDRKGKRPYTRMGVLAVLRSKLHDVREKMEKEKTKKDADVTYTAEELVLKSALIGEERLRVHVHKADDIASLLRLVDEFGLSVTVEHTCDIHEEEIYRELNTLGIPVVFGPMDSFPYKVELRHKKWGNIRCLIGSGVQFGLMIDHPVTLQKMMLFQLRWFLRAGLSK